MDNLKEFKALIERYESITSEEIETLEALGYEYFLGDVDIKEKLTGFGFMWTCSLCIATKADLLGISCSRCYWHIKTHAMCHDDCNSKTYMDISKSQNSKTLLKAFKARAKYMKSILKD